MKYYCAVTNREATVDGWVLGVTRYYLYESGTSLAAQLLLLSMTLAEQLTVTQATKPEAPSGQYWKLRPDSPAQNVYVEAANSLYGDGSTKPDPTPTPGTGQTSTTRPGSTGPATSPSYQLDGPSYIA